MAEVWEVIDAGGLLAFAGVVWYELVKIRAAIEKLTERIQVKA